MKQTLKNVLNSPGLASLRAPVHRAWTIVEPGHRPDFLIIGAQKAGTTTLHEVLAKQPGLHGATAKELHHFNRKVLEGVSLQSYERSFAAPVWRRGLFFESTPEYLYNKDCARRIAEAYPDIRLIAILREPVARAYSSWNMARKRSRLKDWRLTAEGKLLGHGGEGDSPSVFMTADMTDVKPFRECAEIELELMKTGDPFYPNFIRRGFYLEQLQEYWKYFDRDQILVCGFREFSEDPDKTIRRIYDFLGIEHGGGALDRGARSNVGRYDDPISPEDRQFLNEIYRAPNEALFRETGPLDW